MEFPIRLGIRNGKNRDMERSKQQYPIRIPYPYAVPVHVNTLIDKYVERFSPYACERSLTHVKTTLKMEIHVL